MKNVANVVQRTPSTDEGNDAPRNDIKERDFRQIVGGLVFPRGGKPGFGVVLAEDRYEDPKLRKLHRWVLAEIEEVDSLRLIEQCLVFQELFHVESWYGDFNNIEALRLLEDFNESRRHQCELTLYTLPPPCLHDRSCFDFYIDLIRQHLGPGEKTLHFTTCDRLREFIAGFGGTVSCHDISEHPPLAALAYALASLIMCRPPLSVAPEENLTLSFK